MEFPDRTEATNIKLSKHECTLITRILLQLAKVMSASCAGTHDVDACITPEQNINVSCRCALCETNRATEPNTSSPKVLLLCENFSIS